MIAPTSFFFDYGCHVRILEEANALLSLGHQVRIVTYYLGRDWPGLDIARCAPTPWHSDYEVGSSRHKIVFDVLLSWKALVETLRWRPHLIHGHLHEGALIGKVLAMLTHVPLVFDFQGSLTGEMLDHHFISPDSTWYYWWRRLEERIVEMPDVIVTSTTHSKTILAEEFGRTEGVVTLSDCANLDFFRPDCITDQERRTQRAAFGIPEDRVVVVYLGLLTDYQGIPQLIQAAAQLRAEDIPVSFLVMGFPSEKEYQAQAYAAGLTPQDIVFTGKSAYELAPSRLALGDIAIAPKLSATEGSGKILNYMASALPVVTYDNHVSREYLGALGVYAAPAGDVPALREALHSVIAMAPQERRDLGLRLRQRIADQFSWQQSGQQIMDIYNKLWEQ